MTSIIPVYLIALLGLSLLEDQHYYK